MSNTIKCPKCGTTFELDESTYYSIAAQVRDDLLIKEVQEKVDDTLEKAVLQERNKGIELLSKKDSEIAELKAKIATANKDIELAVSKAVEEKNALISNLKLEKATEENNHRDAMKAKDDEIAWLKEHKAKQSVKVLGEDLEQYCKSQFESIRAAAYPNAYFEKDSDLSKSNTKGDFIFRDYDDSGLEYISVMFDMKNEADESTTKKKNEAFFEKLDKDRKAKNCEYAVLVSTLEAENENYNTGIFEVGKYEKMYVVRPQHFLPIISLLRNNAKQSLGCKQELAAIKAQNLDIENFESDLNAIKEKVARDRDLAFGKFDDAVENINKTIKALEKIRDELTGSKNHFRLAADKVESISIKKLTKNNPTMKQKFLDAGVDLSN